MGMFLWYASFGIVLGLLSIYWAWLTQTNRLLNDLSIYDRADWWSATSSFAVLHRMNEVRVPYFLARFPSTTQETLLAVADIGCGGGLLTEAIARANASYAVTGVDLSVHSLRVARAHAAEHLLSSNAVYLQGSIYAIPLSSESQDVVIASDLLEHLEDVPSALQEVLRVLRPGGVFLFDTVARTSWSWLSTYFVAQELLEIVPRGAHDWNLFILPEELTTLLREAGFQVNAKEWAGIVGVLSLEKAINSGSKYDLVSAFVEDPTDLRASYLGYAHKPR